MPLTDARGGPITMRLRVPDETHVGQARRSAASIAASITPTLGDTAAGRLSIIVTELATNLARHAKGGEILLTEIDGGVEVIAIDHGPGIGDLARALQDGFSTGHTPGTGLGAVRRQADLFDVYSRLGSGTVIVCHVRRPVSPAPRIASRTTGPMERAVVCVPMMGEQVCGDGWSIADRSDGSTMVLLVDGLGHGPAAAIAADAAMNVFKKYAMSALPVQVIDAMHLALRPTRGAAVAIALLDPARQLVRFAGVGNVSASIISAQRSQSMVSSNGIVGHQTGRHREFEYAWPDNATMVMHSDGLTSRWSVGAMPGVLSHDLGVLTALVYRDAVRGRDDATVLAVRRAIDDDMSRTVPDV